MDDYCGLRECRLFGMRQRRNRSRCPECDTRYDHWYQHFYDRYYYVQEEQWSQRAYDSMPSGLRHRSFEYGRTIYYNSRVPETRDSNSGAGHRNYYEQLRSYPPYEPHRRPRERSRHDTHRRRSSSSSYNGRNEARRSSSSHHRRSERSGYDHRDQRYESHRDRRYESHRDDHYRERPSMVSDQHLRPGVSHEYTREHNGYGEIREIPREQRTAYELNDRQHRSDFEQPRYQEHQPVLYIEERREITPDPPMQSPPRSAALPLSARVPEQEVGVHGEDFNLKDIRQKRFINCGIECPLCNEGGQHADHPEFACGTMYEIFTHYVGPRIRNRNKWCQTCRHEGRFNISKHHTAEQCKLGMWCDHPDNDLVEQKACFRKWNHPYPSKILGYEPGTVAQMYRNMWRNQRNVDA